MNLFNFGATRLQRDFWGDLFGGDSRTDDVNFPEWYTDPHFQGSQDFLSRYSMDLLNNGPNDYYRPIGEFGTQEFFNALGKGSIGTQAGVDESLARTGRARGGRSAEIAAQTIGNNNAAAVYADYLRAMKGREMFFQTGLGTQRDVRNAGFANQESRNKFNVTGANFNMDKAIYGDTYDRQNSMDIGKTIGAVAPLAGAGLGFLVGGPAGASMGYSIGSSFGGGEGTTPAWLSAVQGSRGSAASNPADEAAGISSIGRINSQDSFDLAKLLASLKMG